MNAALAETTQASVLRNFTLVPIEAVLPDNFYSARIAPGIDLHVQPGRSLSWGDFLLTAPPYSIAIDGYVADAPRFNPLESRLNLNHHQGVDRLTTRATCGQAYYALSNGLMEVFQENSSPRINIFATHPDQDSSFTVWMLKNHERVTAREENQRLTNLAAVEDFIDTSCGFYPFNPHSPQMQEFAWIFHPYVEARMSHALHSMNGQEMAEVILKIGDRIDQYLDGKADQLTLDTRYHVIGGGKKWSMVYEEGYYARTQFHVDGINAFISFLGEKEGRYFYTIARKSAFIQFPIEELCKQFNSIEGIGELDEHRWGCGNTCGGSPQVVGSAQSPRELERATNLFIGNS